MFLLQNFFIYGLSVKSVNIIDLPYHNGANMKGSNKAFSVLKNDLYENKKININKVYNLNANKKHPRHEFGEAFYKCWDSLNSGHISFLIGGDHTCAISNIFASNEHSLYEKKKLGIIWIDAHADFNTMETSPTKNLHGMPVSILCGHTLPILSFGKYLDPSQFLYYGLRDIDSLEFDRFQKYNMNILDDLEYLSEWCSKYDKVHISFDLDGLDPSVFKGVNTPIENGLSINDIEILFNYIKKTGKLQSFDLVEYNPDNEKNNKLILELINNLF